MAKILRLIFIFLVPLFAKAQSVDFTFTSLNGSFCNPSTIQFTQNCTGNPVSFVWDFGNQTQGYTGSELVEYPNAGSYKVTLIAVYEETVLKISKTVVINGIPAFSIGYDKNYICKPGTINFSAQVTGNLASYAWNFQDVPGDIDATTKDVAHDFATFGDYAVALNVADSNGCTAVDSITVKVMKPEILARATPTSGCIPATVSFSADVTVPDGDAVNNYTWDFGDGSPVSSGTSATASRLYGAVGKYSPILSITTRGGCSNTYEYPSIAYGTPPADPVAFPLKAVFCGTESPGFVAQATNANKYFWNWGDSTEENVDDTLTTHKFNTLGVKTVTMRPYFNNCPGNKVVFDVEVIGVIAQYDYANTCADKKTFTFTNTSLGNQSTTLWKFGDSTANVTTLNATHLFPTTGRFRTFLTITDAVTGCADTFSKNIYTANPTLINPDSSICRNDSTSFVISDDYSVPNAAYLWNVAGRKYSNLDSAITVLADSFGVFKNFVSIKVDAFSCRDTILLDHPIRVKGPSLSFTAPASVCFKAPFDIVNTSKAAFPSDSVVLWYWNYGNGPANDTVYQPLAFQYQNPKRYDLKLFAEDINGCKDSLSQRITVNPIPFVKVLPHLDTMCLNAPITLTAFASDSIIWSPAATLSCPDCDTVIANPSVTTQYVVSSTTTGNCTVSDSVLVKVYGPINASTDTSLYYICPRDRVVLNVAPENYAVSWSPSTSLSNPTSHSPTASPQVSTVYTATVRDSVGCFTDSVSIRVLVKTLPKVDAGPDRVVPYNSPFTITPVYSSNITGYLWAPAATLSCSTCGTPSGVAVNSATYTISVTSDSGCVSKDDINIFIECKAANIFMPTAFTPNNDGRNDFYYPITRGIKTIGKFVIYNRGGKIIFAMNNFAPNNNLQGWNGMFGGAQQPQGSYVYVLEALCEQGEKLVKQGSFLLLR